MPQPTPTHPRHHDHLTAGVVEGWQELQAILVSGFASLVAIAGGPDGSAVANALREHDRLGAAHPDWAGCQAEWQHSLWNTCARSPGRP